MGETELRRATADDASIVADVYLASFHAAYEFPSAHSDEQVRAWIVHALMPNSEVWVAVAPDGTVVALMALTPDVLDQLYVAPGWTGRGIGGRLVALAKARRPGGLDLYTFRVHGSRRASSSSS